MATQTEKVVHESPSLIKRIASRFHVDADKLMTTLKLTAFKQKDGEPEITNEQMMALLVVADQYGLNPFTREIYAYPDKGGIVPVVGVDGWSRIINEHKQFDGMEFTYSDKMDKPEGAKVACPEWIEVTIYRKDRTKPTTIREYLDEVYRSPFTKAGKNGSAGYTVNGPWQTHPKRFLRHKGIIQCGRIALGFTGIYDQDEAERIIDMGSAIVVSDGDGNVLNQDQPLALEMTKLDPFVDKLIEQSKAINNWGPAHQYAMKQFQGREFQYVTDRLRDAQIDAMPSALSERQVHQANVSDLPVEELDERQNSGGMNGLHSMPPDDDQPGFFN